MASFRAMYSKTSRLLETSRSITPSLSNRIFFAHHIQLRQLHQSSAPSFERTFLRSNNPDSQGSPKSHPPTNFAELDVLGYVPQPEVAVSSCLTDGFVLSDNTRVEGSGLMFAGGQAFAWNPWVASDSISSKKSANNTLLNKAGQFEIQKEALGVFDLLWPKPGKSTCWNEMKADIMCCRPPDNWNGTKDSVSCSSYEKSHQRDWDED
jgi:hypothetical protein